MSTATTASSGLFSEDEQSQLRITIKKFTINYKQATGKEIVFSPSMLELGETEYSIGSANSSSSKTSSSSSSSNTRLKQSVRQERSVVYLPDTHKIRPIFTTYYKKYSPTIGNPALVFIDKATFLDYMKYATKLISDEQKKAAAAAAAMTPPIAPTPSSLVDLNKERQLNDNIKFVIETIFSKNRVLTVGGDFKVQVMVGGRKVLLNQEYYIESLPTIVDKSTLTTTVPIYMSADSKVFELEGKADEKKEDIDKKETTRKNKEEDLEAAQRDLNTAKDALRTAIKNAAATPSIPLTAAQRQALEAAIQTANKALLDARTAYKKAREEEKIVIAERVVILNKINQYKYGRENSKITEILSKVSSLKREMLTKELEIAKIKLSIDKVGADIVKKNDEIDETEKKLQQEIRDAAKIFGILTGGAINYDTLLAEINSKNSEIALRTRNLAASRTDPEASENYTNNMLKISQYDIIGKRITKLKEQIKQDKVLVDITSSSSLHTKKKMLEANVTTLEVERDKKKKEMEKLNLSLYDYTLRVYIFDMPPLSLISKYLENGKENPQFASMHKKFYKSAESDSALLSRVGSKQSFLSTVNCAKDRFELKKMFNNIVDSTKRKIEDVIDGIGIQDGGAGDGAGAGDGDGAGAGAAAMDRIKAALRHPADESTVMEDPDRGWTAKILKKSEDADDTSKYMSMVGMGPYPLFFTLFGVYRMHKPIVEPPSEDTIDVRCDSPPPGSHSKITVHNLNLLLSDDRPVPDMFPFPASSNDMSEYMERIKDYRKPYENYKFELNDL